MGELIKVLIADDHTLFRDGLEALLKSVSDIEVVATVSNGKDAVQSAKSFQPDVVLMDLQMPGINGIEATRQIIQTSPHIGVIIVSMFEDDDSIFSAMRAGARGYILKGADQNEMLRAIRSVVNGGALFGPSIAMRLINYFKIPLRQTPQVFPELTNREREILELVAQGKNNAEIAGNLTISLKTVRNHVSNIFNKLQVTDRVQAALRARDAGFGEDKEN
jgi:DNA-binding NarL/FixJ family response regulator